MKILIVYATYSSGTLQASEILAEELEKYKQQVTITNVANIDEKSFADYDLIILGSPSWFNQEKDGMPHHSFLEFFKKTEQSTLPYNYAVFGLGDAAYARFCGAVTHLEEFIDKVQGKRVIDSLKIEGFYFDKETNTQLLKAWALAISALPL